MAFVASLILVFGTVLVFVANVVLSDRGVLAPGFEQMIHAEIPWLLVSALVAGVLLGVVSVVRKRSWPKVGLVTIEVVVAAFALFFFLDLTRLPAHPLAVHVGERFPAYSLTDQDGAVHTNESDGRRGAALYVFYRGDW
jgi:hypothetical protein